MADFIAVIRRAVSGLSSNTPEMREKVYDKARTAVRRQLESMNPRPSDELLARQLDKLEAAIVEVDAEYAEALPADEAPVVAEPPPVIPAAAPVPAPEPEPEPEPETEPRIAASQPLPPVVEPTPVEPVTEPEPVEPEPPRDSVVEAPSVDARDTGPVDWAYEGPSEPISPPAVTPETSEKRVAALDWPAERAASDIDYATEAEEQVDGFVPVSELPGGVAEFSAHGEEQEAAEGAPSEDTVAAWELYEASRERETLASNATMPASGHFEPELEAPAVFEAPAGEPEPTLSPETALRGEPSVDIPHGGGLDSRETEAARDEFDLLAHTHAPADAAARSNQPSLDLLQWEPEAAAAPAPAENHDAFAQWFAENAAANQSEIDEHLEATDNDPMIDDGGVTFPESAEPATDEALLAGAASNAAYGQKRTKPRPRRSVMPLVLSVAVLVVIAGGGYAAWSNRDAIQVMIADMTGASTADDTAQTPVADTTTDLAPEATTPAETDSGAGTDTASNDQPAETAPPALADGETSGKFTQRLQTDGTEVDEGEAPASSAGEGRSVAQQTSAPSNETAAAGSGAAADGAGANQGAGPTTENAAALEGGQKALLYEERIGQATPTAHTGRVEWSLVSETGENGRAEPEVQGKLVIPDSGLSALITFKRNADNSLPASHLIEIVFSVPPNFEGGAIQDVQRVAMKKTEQDRGDPLVAVPARITDDTFLIALNDFKDVVQRNIELMRDRDWIDIPVTYRNGRRALITLDKGAAGKADFDKAIKEWAALGTSGG
ncbi:hypothetical protein [Rhizobium halophytocola]|uniref:Transcriptional regulator n=1 Tax=Rhizobium halophytocola TaxID=735519 RepID=A0ABS4DSQ4_9HYPH|nr:hypothetical protein [Rhizobium halophytocola]MBP1848729.1 hypothetical protein [Rhizobium halophytocola]